VQTDQPTSHFRATKRSSRRAGDSLNVSLPDEAFASQVKKLTPPARQEEYIVISGKHTYPTQAKIVLKKLVTPREEIESSHVASMQRPEPETGSTPRRRSVIVN
jgi:hypothetical protein